MIIRGAESRMRDFTTPIVDLFFECTHYKPIDFILEFTDDLNLSRLNLSPKKLHQELKKYPYAPNTTGAILLPYSKEDPPAILIKKDSFNEDVVFIHDLTYYLSYLFDSRWSYKAADLEFSMYSTPSDILRIWCDWHAELLAYSCEIVLASRSSVLSKQLLPRFQEEDLLIRQELYPSLIEEKINPHIFLTHVMRVLGTYVAFNMVYPKLFNKNTLPEALTNICGNKIKTLFTFLCNTKTNKELVPKIAEFDSLIESLIIYSYS